MSPLANLGLILVAALAIGVTAAGLFTVVTGMMMAMQSHVPMRH